MSQATLFDPGPSVQVPILTVDARRTQRQRYQLRRGIHPATGLALANNDETCGSCAHFERRDYHTRTYFKCGLVLQTHGPGADIRSSWPACGSWATRGLV